MHRSRTVMCKVILDRCHAIDYISRMIESFRNKGLAELFSTGQSRKIAPDLHKRIKVRLAALDAATALIELNQPGFDFHPLKGKPQRYTIHVNGPWCITFECENGKPLRVDLEQYH